MSKSKKNIPKKIREQAIARANGTCEYCKLLIEFSTAPFALDHIKAEVNDGKTELDNLAQACFYCNGSKFTASEALDPLTNNIAPLFHPRKDNWADHFKWSADYLVIIGLTPTGRATIERLKMNRSSSINLRRVTRGSGHPPK